MTPWVLVTGNEDKALEVERILGDRPPIAALDLPEIQELDIRRVVEEKAREAHRRLGRPVVVEEVGFYLDALGGFPGPLIKWMLQAVGPDGVARTALALGDPRATARCVLAHFDGSNLVLAEGRVRGEPGRRAARWPRFRLGPLVRPRRRYAHGRRARR